MKGDVIAGANEHERSPGVVQIALTIAEAGAGSCFLVEIIANNSGTTMTPKLPRFVASDLQSGILTADFRR
jgi:hypothetical protein